MKPDTESAGRGGRLAGLADAAFASLATFASGLAAARLLAADELGAYALIFVASLLAATVPRQLITVPAEAALVRATGGRVAVSALRHTIVLAWPFALLAALVPLLSVPAVPSEVLRSSAWSLGLTGAAYAVTAPLQEHARSILHLAGKHSSAAVVSLVGFVTTVATLAILGYLGVPPTLMPLGALATGKAASLAWAAVQAGPRSDETSPLTRSGLSREGGWLVLSAFSGQAAGWVAALLVTHLATPAALGSAEAARIVAQPVLVLAVGLSAARMPVAMRHAVRGSSASANRNRRQYIGAVTGAGALYLLAALMPSSMNPLMAMVPLAFEEPRLVEFSILATLANGIVFLHRGELIAQGRTRVVGLVEAVSAGTRGVVGLGAGRLGPWTIPLGFMLQGWTRWAAYRLELKRSYDAAAVAIEQQQP